MASDMMFEQPIKVDGTNPDYLVPHDQSGPRLIDKHRTASEACEFQNEIAQEAHAMNILLGGPGSAPDQPPPIPKDCSKLPGPGNS